jgi:hypothetical protein
MAVTDNEVWALRPFLTGDPREHIRRLDQLEPGESIGPLAKAVFWRLVERRFSGASADDVIKFVGEVRALGDQIAEKVNPHQAERLIQSVYTDERAADISSKTKNDLIVLLMPKLIIDEHLDEGGVEELLVSARKLADEAFG